MVLVVPGVDAAHSPPPPGDVGKGLEGTGGCWLGVGGSTRGLGSAHSALQLRHSPHVRALNSGRGVKWPVFGMKGAVYFALAEAMPARSGPRSSVSHR